MCYIHTYYIDFCKPSDKLSFQLFSVAKLKSETKLLLVTIEKCLNKSMPYWSKIKFLKIFNLLKPLSITHAYPKLSLVRIV